MAASSVNRSTRRVERTAREARISWLPRGSHRAERKRHVARKRSEEPDRLRPRPLASRGLVGQLGGVLPPERLPGDGGQLAGRRGEHGGYAPERARAGRIRRDGERRSRREASGEVRKGADY